MYVALQLLIEHRVASSLGDFYLGELSPIADRKKKRASMGSRASPPNFAWLLKTLSLLIRSASTDLPGERPPHQIDLPPPLDTDRRIVTSRDLYRNCLTTSNMIPFPLFSIQPVECLPCYLCMMV
jgi:hypothetical protein